MPANIRETLIYKLICCILAHTLSETSPCPCFLIFIYSILGLPSPSHKVTIGTYNRHVTGQWGKRRKKRGTNTTVHTRHRVCCRESGAALGKPSTKFLSKNSEPSWGILCLFLWVKIMDVVRETAEIYRSAEKSHTGIQVWIEPCSSLAIKDDLRVEHTLYTYLWILTWRHTVLPGKGFPSSLS